MNWTVRRRFTARAAREGAMRIAVDSVIVSGAIWGNAGRVRGFIVILINCSCVSLSILR